MARPQSITDDEVLASARAVFLEKGVTATVEEVAARCRVGEATIFRRFPTKQALFLAAMDTGAEPPWFGYLKERAGHGDVRETLTALAGEMVAFGRKMIPLLLMRMSNPALLGRERPPARMLRVMQALTEFFSIEMAAGRVGGSDARVTARIWLASVQQFVMFETMTRMVDPLPMDVFIGGLVEMFVTPAPKGKKA
jgi:AcrR family transcriptional regulator